MPQSSGTQQQSLRSACERCRLHKLKCTTIPQEGSNGPAQCTRCVRAKAECVFGRRVPPKHRNSSVADRSATSDAIGSTTSAKVAVQSSNRVYGNTTPIEVQPSVAINSSPQRSCVCSESVSANATPQVMGIDFNAMSCTSSPFEQGCMSLDSIDLYTSAYSMMEAEFSSSSSHHQLSSLSISPDMDYENMDDFLSLSETQSLRGPSSLQLSEKESSHMIIRLSSLIKEIHVTQHTLQERSIRGASNPSWLAEYPIGSVLQAAHTFSNIASDLTRLAAAGPSNDDMQATDASTHSSSSWSTDASGFPADLNFGGSQMPSVTEPNRHVHKDGTSGPTLTGNQQQAKLDTPAAMLVFCCYISLSRLYCDVFHFFENTLNGRPQQADDRRYLKQQMQHTRTLQLKELSTEFDTEFKILKAVRMLLSAFQAAEASLGLPSSLDMGSSINTTNKSDGDSTVSAAYPHKQHLLRAMIHQRAEVDDTYLEETLNSLVTHVENLKRLLRVQSGLH